MNTPHAPGGKPGDAPGGKPGNAPEGQPGAPIPGNRAGPDAPGTPGTPVGPDSPAAAAASGGPDAPAAHAAAVTPDGPAVPGGSRRRARLAAAVLGAAVLALPAAVTGGYAIGIVNLMLINVIVVLGLNVIWGFAGQIALGQAGFVAVGAYAVAVMSVQLHLPFWLDLGCGTLLVSLAALGLGLATLKLKSFYLGLATLSFGEIVTQVLLNWKAISESANGIVNIPQASLLGAPLAHGWQQYYLLLAFAAAGVFVSRRLTRVRFGIECRAVRGNERAAEMIGIDTFRIKLAAFVLSAAYGGVAGGLYAQLYQAVSPDVFSFDYMVSVLAMLLIGGAGSTEGAVLGAVIVTLLPELLRFLGTAYLMVYGFGLVALIIYAPRGIWGTVEVLLSRILGRRTGRRGKGGRPMSAVIR